MDAIQLLGEDGWERVLSKVDPRDLKSCSETCLLFQKILNRTKGRNSWLFGEILPHVFNYLYVARKKSGCCSVCSHVNSSCYWKAMFNCRLVCKSWCTFTDHHLETNLDPEQYLGSEHPTEENYIFYGGKRITAFLTTFGRSKGNPLIGRKVSIKQWGIDGEEDDIHDDDFNENDIKEDDIEEANINEDDIDEDDIDEDDINEDDVDEDEINEDDEEINEDDVDEEEINEEEIREYRIRRRREEKKNYERYTAALVEFLSVFGKEVRTVTFSEEPELCMNPKHMEYCRNIQSLLVQLPNLRTLELFCISRYPDKPFAGLDAYIAEAQLPDLYHLENIRLDCVRKEMAELLLRKYSGQLKVVEVIGFRCLEESIAELTLLKELAIHMEDEHSTLELLRMLPSPLEKLRIRLVRPFLGSSDLKLWAIDKFLGNIEHLPIKELIINSGLGLDIAKFEQISMSPQITIQKVSIDCRTTNQSASLNFLSCFPNLEEVRLMFYSDKSDADLGEEEALEVPPHLKEANLYESNIWEVIPSLKKFSVLCWSWNRRTTDFRYYSRKGYDKIKKGSEAAKTTSKNINV